MYPVAQTAHMNELHNLILAATQCVRCTDPACLKECALRADLRGALEFFLIKPRNGWMQEREQAATCAGEAIQESFS